MHFISSPHKFILSENLAESFSYQKMGLARFQKLSFFFLPKNLKRIIYSIYAYIFFFAVLKQIAIIFEILGRRFLCVFCN